ncbi:MAG TPA: GntR family transcriptional regulator [Actinomycetes bacterium]|nr:GntR family transcriptional regulator [Actinomycetes bacterium]
MARELSHAVLRPARGGNAFEQTVERLAQSIKLGVFQAGDRLPPERELADLMQVSRMTLREALAALRDTGFVETRRGRAGGTYVSAIDHRRVGRPPAGNAGSTMGQPSGRLLRDALEFRRVVEGGAAGLAATRSMNGELTEAEGSHLLEMLRAVDVAPDDARRRIADSRLHLAVAFVAGSESLTAAVAEAQVRLGEMLAAIPVLRRNIEHSNAQHRAFVEAILVGDPERARAAMEEHCDATSALLRGLLA